MWMDLEIITLSEVSQTEKDKYHFDITYMWDLKYDTNELIYEPGKGSQLKLTVAATGKGMGAGRGWDGQMPTATHRTDKQRPTVGHREVHQHP